MPDTTARGFRYPKLDRTETPDVPRDIKALADDIDAMYTEVMPRPAFGKIGRIHRDPTTGQKSLDTGTAWTPLGGLFRTSHTWAIPGFIFLYDGADNVTPGFFVPVLSGTTVKYLGLRHTTVAGACEVRVKRLTPALVETTVQSAVNVTNTPVTTLLGSPVTLTDGDFLRMEVTSISSNPQHLSVSVLLEVQS